MFQRNEGAPLILHYFLIALTLVMFAFAGFVWPAPVEQYRVRFIGAGLFFLVLSSLL